jgi:hypothetical protein
MKETTYKTHQKILGAMLIAYSVMAIIGAVSLLVAIDFIKVFVFEDDIINFVTAFSRIIGIILLVVSIPGIIAGAGMLMEKNWAKTFSLIMGLFFLWFFPFGTILGAYAIWFSAQHVIRDKMPVMATDLIKHN